MHSVNASVGAESFFSLGPDFAPSLPPGGSARSFPFLVEPFAFYKITFKSQCGAKALWGAVFFNEAGEELPADHYGGIDPSQQMAWNTACFRGKAGARKAIVRFQAAAGSGLEIEAPEVTRVEASGVLKWADELYQMLPAAHIELPADRFTALPRTFGRLRAREKLRVVMLGDSIINDTGNSPFDLLVEQLYSGARIEVVTSVRSGAGLWYFKEESRVTPFVLAYEPDLLVIGGISHRNDVESIRSTIRQVRVSAEPEILTLTDIFSGLSNSEQAGWTETPQAKGDCYRARLKEMAAEEDVAFLDLAGLWGAYLKRSGEPLSYFLRDDIHANERGRQIAARMLRDYFRT